MTQTHSTRVDFLPRSFLRKRARHKRVYREAALVLVAAGCLGGWWAVRNHRDAGLRSYARSLQNQVHAAQVQHNEMARLRAEHKQLTHQVSIRHELAQPITPTQLLDQLGAALPGSVAIRHLSLIAQRPAAGGGSRSRGKSGSRAGHAGAPHRSGPNLLHLKVEALAPGDMTVAQAVAALSDHPLFDDVKLHYSRAAKVHGRGQDVGRVFELSMKIDLDRRFRWKPGSTASAGASTGALADGSASGSESPRTLTRGVTLAH